MALLPAARAGSFGLPLANSRSRPLGFRRLLPFPVAPANQPMVTEVNPSSEAGRAVEHGRLAEDEPEVIDAALVGLMVHLESSGKV